MRLLCRFHGPAALLAAGALLAGCGGTVVDTSNIEAQAQKELREQLPTRLSAGKSGSELRESLGVSPNEKITEYECPDEVDLEPGETFSCTATFANGQKAQHTFRIVNDEADVTATYFGPPKDGG